MKLEILNEIKSSIENKILENKELTLKIKANEYIEKNFAGKVINKKKF